MQMTALFVFALFALSGAAPPQAVVQTAPLLDSTLTFDVGVEKFQWKPQVAHDGTNYFAVWEDSRQDEATDFAIYGARLAPNGKVIDSVGIAISGVDRYIDHIPGVAFDGTNYLVTWQGVNPDRGNQDLYGARVSPDGVVLDTGGFLIASADGHQFFGNLAFNGTEYLVAWFDGRNTVAWVYCARVLPSGEVLDPDGIAVMRRDNQNYPGGLAVAASDSNWLIVADEGGGSSVIGAVIKRDGTVARVESLAYRPGDSRWFPDVDYSPEDGVYFVAWQDWRSGAPPEGNGVWGARVTRSGEVLDPGGFPIADNPAKYQGVPAVAWNGRYFMVAYIENNGAPTWYDIWGKRILPDGTIIDSLAPRQLSNEPMIVGFPDIVRAGDEWFTAWEDPRGNSDAGWGTDIYGTRVDTAGRARDPYPADLVISSSAPRQFKAKAATHGSEYFAVWQEFRGVNSWDLYAARFDRAGALVGQPFPLSSNSHVVLDPTVAAGSSCYLVAWEDESYGNGTGGIIGRRVGFDGVPLDTAIVISPDYINRYPVAAFDGTSFMVAYWEGNFPYEARARRVEQDGSMGSEFTVADIGWRNGPGWNLHTSFGLAFDGTNYLLVWPDWQESESQYDVKGARFTPSGTVLDPDGFFVTRTRSRHEDYPCLTYGGGQYFAAWHDSTGDNLMGGRITPGGQSLDTLGITISGAAAGQRLPGVTFDGTDYFVAWEDERNDIGDIYGARVTTRGVVLHPQGLPIATAPWRQSYPAVVAGEPGRVLVVYSSYLDTAYSASRLQALVQPVTGIEAPAVPAPGLGVVSRASPNPFSRATALTYSLPAPARVEFAVFDVAGRRVKTLESGQQAAGVYALDWDGRDELDRELPAGIYSIRGRAGNARCSEAVRLVR
jgi:hypothetical protein